MPPTSARPPWCCQSTDASTFDRPPPAPDTHTSDEDHPSPYTLHGHVDYPKDRRSRDLPVADAPDTDRLLSRLKPQSNGCLFNIFNFGFEFCTRRHPHSYILNPFFFGHHLTGGRWYDVWCTSRLLRAGEVEGCVLLVQLVHVSHGQHMASTRSAHGQHVASTRSAHGQHTASRQHMVSTWSAWVGTSCWCSCRGSSGCAAHSTQHTAGSELGQRRAAARTVVGFRVASTALHCTIPRR